MAGEAIRVEDAQVTICTAASNLLTNTLNTGETITLISTTKNFVDFVLTGTFAAAPATGKYIDLYRRDMNIDGTKDAPLPVLTSYEHKHVGSFPVQNVTGEQVLPLNGVYCPHDAEFYIKNGTAQTLNSGYTIKATSWTWGPAA